MRGVRAWVSCVPDGDLKAKARVHVMYSLSVSSMGALGNAVRLKKVKGPRMEPGLREGRNWFCS